MAICRTPSSPVPITTSMTSSSFWRSFPPQDNSRRPGLDRHRRDILLLKLDFNKKIGVEGDARTCLFPFLDGGTSGIRDAYPGGVPAPSLHPKSEADQATGDDSRLPAECGTAHHPERCLPGA